MLCVGLRDQRGGGFGIGQVYRGHLFVDLANVLKYKVANKEQIIGNFEAIIIGAEIVYGDVHGDL